MLRLFAILLAASALLVAGCGGAEGTRGVGDPPRLQPVTAQTPDARARLVGILKAGDDGALVKDDGWREYVLEIKNLSAVDLTVKNVRLLNPSRRYIDSASTYEQLLVPPNTTVAVAGDVAKTTAGIAVGQIIPYGGYLVSVLSSATSTAMSGTKVSAERTFAVRILKGVELAAGGNVAGSAFLPDTPGAEALVVDYVRGHDSGRIEIALNPSSKKGSPSAKGAAALGSEGEPENPAHEHPEAQPPPTAKPSAAHETPSPAAQSPPVMTPAVPPAPGVELQAAPESRNSP